MKSNSLVRFFSYFLKSKYRWKIESGADILILDGKVLEKILPALADRSYSVLQNVDTIYLRFLIQASFKYSIFGYKRILLEYHLQIINFVKPKLLLTFTDSSPLYWEIDKRIHKKINFLTIQNAQHFIGDTDLVEEEYMHMIFQQKPFYSNLACISKFDLDDYLSKGVKVLNHFFIGSLKLGSYYHSYSNNSIKKIFDLCIVSNTRNDKTANLKVWELVREFVSKHNVTIIFALKGDSQESNSPILKIFENTKLIYAKRTEFSSHIVSDYSEVTIGFSSSLLRQTFARGNKIYPLNFASKIFSPPYNLLGLNLSPSYDEFERTLLNLIKIDRNKYIESNKDLMNYFDTRDCNQSAYDKLKKAIDSFF